MLPMTRPQNWPPAILVSVAYLNEFDRWRSHWDIRDWVLDSGAFSAFNAGLTIDLDEYIAICRERKERDPQLTEVFALDVIGDWRAGLRNTERMWNAGIPAIPAFHPGREPWDVLECLARDFPKIALGGVVGVDVGTKRKLFDECFARVWPKRIHGFGVCSETILMRYPFESVDATNWELGPCGFGRWAYFGDMSIRGGTQDLTAEIYEMLRWERDARRKWQPLFDRELPGYTPGIVRFATVSTGREPFLTKEKRRCEKP